jgi:hypothetical protein
VDTVSADNLIGFRQAEREYGIPRWCLRALRSEPGPGRSKLVRRADVEQLVTTVTRCKGCGKPVQPGRSWHPACRAKATNDEIRDDPDRAAARSEASRERMRRYWDDPSKGDQRRAVAGRRTKEHAEREDQEFARLKGRHGLHDVAEAAAFAFITRKYVREVAGLLGLGIRVPGWNGKPWLLFTAGELEEIRDAVHQDSGPKHAARWAAQKDRLRSGRELFDIAQAARSVDRSKSIVQKWANKLGVGTSFQLAGSRTLVMLTRAELDQIREAIAHANVAASNGHPRRRRDWYVTRFKPPPNSPVLGRMNGKLGGRPSELKKEEGEEIARQIDELADVQHLGQRRIAEKVGVSRSVVRYRLEQRAKTP